MHLTARTTLLALLSLPAVAAALQAQPLRLRPGLIRLGTDSVDILGSAKNDPGTSSLAVMAVSRGTGADRDALVEVHSLVLREPSGRALMTLLDTVFMGADDLLFRRSRSVRIESDGSTGSDITVLATRTGLRQITRERDRADTLTMPFGPSGQPPFATPYFAMRAAPLSERWRGSYETFVPSATQDNTVRTVTIDSVHRQRIAGRPAWVVYSRVAPDLRWTVSIDSASRDMMRFSVTNEQRDFAATYASRRFREARPAPLRLPPIDPTRMRPLVGRYFLRGVRELGSELRLLQNGRFEFGLTYGALDETGAGEWRVVDGAVVLQSDGSPRVPSVQLLSAVGKSTDSIQVTVVDTAGRPLSGLTLDFSRKKADPAVAQSSRNGYTFRYAPGSPPTEIGVGVEMVEFRVAFPLPQQPKAAYRFVFRPGDIGVRRFEAERLAIEPGSLVLTLNGRAMIYVRN